MRQCSSVSSARRPSVASPAAISSSRFGVRGPAGRRRRHVEVGHGERSVGGVDVHRETDVRLRESDAKHVRGLDVDACSVSGWPAEANRDLGTVATQSLSGAEAERHSRPPRVVSRCRATTKLPRRSSDASSAPAKQVGERAHERPGCMPRDVGGEEAGSRKHKAGDRWSSRAGRPSRKVRVPCSLKRSRCGPRRAGGSRSRSSDQAFDSTATTCRCLRPRRHQCNLRRGFGRARRPDRARSGCSSRP